MDALRPNHHEVEQTLLRLKDHQTELQSRRDAIDRLMQINQSLITRWERWLDESRKASS